MMRIIMLKAPQQIASHAETFLEELVFHPFVGRDERQAPLKTPAWEARVRVRVRVESVK